jgi:hypothetical protein
MIGEFNYLDLMDEKKLKWKGKNLVIPLPEKSALILKQVK